MTKAESFRKILRRASSLPTDVVDSPTVVSVSCGMTDQPTYTDAAVATDPVPGIMTALWESCINRNTHCCMMHCAIRK